MNTVFTQSIEHPEFGTLLAQAVAFAALGTNDKTVNALRKQGKLIEGEHFIRMAQPTGLPKLFWTMAGLQDLSLALGTDRAVRFHADLRQWLQGRTQPPPPDSALQHQPRGAAVAPIDAADQASAALTERQTNKTFTTAWETQPTSPFPPPSNSLR